MKTVNRKRFSHSIGIGSGSGRRALSSEGGRRRDKGQAERGHRRLRPPGPAIRGDLSGSPPDRSGGHRGMEPGAAQGGGGALWGEGSLPGRRGPAEGGGPRSGGDHHPHQIYG